MTTNKSGNKKNKILILLFTLFVICVGAVVSVIIVKEVKKSDNKAETTTSQSTDKTTEDTSQTAEITTTEQVTTVITKETTKATTTAKTTKKVSTPTDTAINAFTHLPYFDASLASRYIEYKNLKNISYEEAILKVNIGLDKPFYTNIKTVSKPSAINVLCNKYNSISSYTPSDLVNISQSNSIKSLQLRSEAAQAFEKMCDDARAQGYTIKGASAYRSYSYQTTLYNNYKNRDGQQNADTYSARAGHSEHQTGLAIDVQGSSGTYSSFANTKESKWVNENAHKYGYIVRYTDSKQNITGYIPEAWHLRYLGVDLATKVKESGFSFDEYYAMYLA